MVSVGLLYDAQRLVQMVQPTPQTVPSLLESFTKLEVADFPSVLQLSQECHWIEVEQNNLLILTTRGKAICEAAEAEAQLRMQISDLLLLTSPSWAKKIADGRSEAVKVMPDEVRQIFREAGLLDGWTDELVAWWDSTGLAARNRKNERKLEIGRKAERLSIDFESDRTGSRPEWKGIESNYAGYDLLSIVEADDPRPKPIEVKGSSLRLSESFLYFSRNEWEVAQGNSTYCLHLWLVRDRLPNRDTDLRIVDTNHLAAHIPYDQGTGAWENVKIPFRSFWN